MLWRQCKKRGYESWGLLRVPALQLQCFSLVAVHRGSQKKDIFYIFGHGPPVCRGGQEIQGHPVLYQQYCSQGNGKISDGGSIKEYEWQWFQAYENLSCNFTRWKRFTLRQCSIFVFFWGFQMRSSLVENLWKNWSGLFNICTVASGHKLLFAYIKLKTQKENAGDVICTITWHTAIDFLIGKNAKFLSQDFGIMLLFPSDCLFFSCHEIASPSSFLFCLFASSLLAVTLYLLFLFRFITVSISKPKLEIHRKQFVLALSLSCSAFIICLICYYS